MVKNSLIIGSRGSRLALWQTNFIKSELENRFPQIRFEVKIIKTTGDQLLDVALSKIGDKGLFTRQIETALLSGEIDLAVHSLKDLQTVQPEGLKIGAVTKRETPNDALISKRYDSIDALPSGARVATGSLRRRSQLLNRRPDLQIFEIRGNVPTRLQKFKESDLDAMILAYAGVHRLGLTDWVKQIVPTEVMLPAVAQGVMGVEIRADDADLEAMLGAIDDADVFSRISAERAFLRRLEGGCQVPIAGFAELENGGIYLRGFVGNLDGRVVVKDSIRGETKRAEDLGTELAERLIEKGASEILAAARAEPKAATVI